MSGGILSLFCVKPRLVRESWRVRVESVDLLILFVMPRVEVLPRCELSEGLAFLWVELWQ